MAFQGVVSYGPDTTPTYLASQGTFNLILAAPLDGVVAQAVANDSVNIGRDIWNVNTAYGNADFSTSLALLESRIAQQRKLERNNVNHWTARDEFSGFGQCYKNFVQLQLSYSGRDIIDPFGPTFGAMYDKMLSVVQFAQDAAMRGVWLDVEPYGNIWTYTAQPLKNLHTFSEYQLRWYDIGYDFGQDIFGVSRNLSLMTVFAYDSYATAKLNSPFPADQDNTYGLYKSFLDGILDGYGASVTIEGGGNGRIILTTEGTFGVADAASTIRYGLGQINGTFDYLVPPPIEEYWGSSNYFFDSRVVQHGLAFWPSYPSFNPSTPNANHWTPAVLQACMEIAIANNVEWIWIYNPDYTFYNGTALPQVYVDAVAAARSTGGL
jgi:hypothetical protein